MKKTLLASVISTGFLLATPHSFADDKLSQINISGVAEVLATYNDAEDGSSDIDVDTVELTVEAPVNDFIRVSTTLKYEDDPEGEDDFFVDEAIIVVGEEEGDISLTVGRTGIPFGVIRGATWTGPLTDDFTDNTDDLAMVSFGADSFSAEVYAFKGDQENDDNVENFGANIAYEANGLSLGAGFLSNIGNTDAFGQTEDGSAFRLNAAYSLGNIDLSAEFIQAEEFDDLGGDKPSAAHMGIDIGTDFGLLALGYSMTSDAEQLGLPEQLLVASLARELGENAEVIFELVNEEDYAGEDSNTVNAVLAVSF